MFCKDKNKITIGDYSLFEETGDIRYLSTFKYAPRFLYLKDAKSLIIEVQKIMAGEDAVDDVLLREKHRINSEYRILLLVGLYQSAYNLMVHVNEINVWRHSIGKEIKHDDRLDKHLKRIKDKTGIEVKKIEDLAKLKHELDRITDKYAENFKGVQPEKLTFMQVVMGILSAADRELNYNMRVKDFAILKTQTEQKKSDGRH